MRPVYTFDSFTCHSTFSHGSSRHRAVLPFIPLMWTWCGIWWRMTMPEFNCVELSKSALWWMMLCGTIESVNELLLCIAWFTGLRSACSTGGMWYRRRVLPSYTHTHPHTSTNRPSQQNKHGCLHNWHPRASLQPSPNKDAITNCSYHIRNSY